MREEEIVMYQDDSCKLLSECDAGLKMAVSAIDEVLPAVESPHLRQELSNSRRTHVRLQDQAKELLSQHNAVGKAPSPMAKSMNWLKTNMKLVVQPGDQSVADLMVDGCNMGVKSLHRYCNRYPDADKESRQLVDRVIEEEQRLTRDIQSYL